MSRSASHYLSGMRLAMREIHYRLGNFALAMLSIAIAVGVFFTTLGFLNQHTLNLQAELDMQRARTDQQLMDAEAAIEHAMARLGFNLTIIPAKQQLGDWYREDFAEKTMPEETLIELEEATPETLERLTGVLRWRLEWPEHERTVVITGVGDNAKKIPHTDRENFLRPVPRGQVEVGYSLHRNLDISEGDTIGIKGRSFTVIAVRSSLGTMDDLTLFMNLHDAQALLDKEGRINEIRALQSPEAWRDIEAVRSELAKINPDLKVIERSEEALMNARTRLNTIEAHKKLLSTEYERKADTLRATRLLVWLILSLVMFAATVWLALLTIGNVGERQSEVGILAALGYDNTGIIGVFLWRTFFSVIPGCVIGYAGGLAFAAIVQSGRLGPAFVAPGLYLQGFFLAAAICGFSAMAAVYKLRRIEPAAILARD